MDRDQRAPSWLKATIRAALIAVAVGGGLFVLSQFLAPSEAHADTASASIGSGPDDSLLGPVLQGVGSTLGSVTSTADAAVGGVSAVAPATTSAVSHLVSSTVSALPAPVQAPVNQVTAPVAKTVTQVTAPVAKTSSAVAAAKPVSAVLGTVSGTVDGVVGEVETIPVVGGLVNGIAGQSPVSTVTSPAAAGLDDAVSSVSDAVGTALTGTGDALVVGVAGSGSGSGEASSPVVGGLLPSIDASSPADVATAAVVSRATSPFGPLLGGVLNRAGTVWAPGHFTQVAGTQVSVGGPVPSGLPAGPLSPLAGLSGSGASTSTGGRSSGTDPLQLAGAPGTFVFPAADAGLSQLANGDALPASPVFEHDSSPD